MANLDTACRILSDLVAFPSLSGQSNREIAQYAGAHLEAQGFRVAYDADDTGERLNVIASIGPDVEGGVVLCGHLDVVPASPDRWQGDPFVLRRIDDRLIGRGAVDMKGFIAACMAWAEDLSRDVATLTVPVHFVFTFDEEVGSFGAAQVGAFLRGQVPQPALAIVGEPTGMEPISGHRGILELITRVTGSSGHASDPRGRVNAVTYAARMVTELARRADDLAAPPYPDTPFEPPWTTLSVGRIEGGEARNVIPDACSFLWEIRPLPGVDGHRILRDILAWVDRELVPRMIQADGATGIETELVADCRSLEAHEGSPAAALIGRLWTNTPPRVVSFATDAGYLQDAGIDTIVFGPGSMDQMHQPEEHITTAELSDGLRFLERLGSYLAGDP